MQKGQFCIHPGLFHPTCMQNERFCIHLGELTQLGMKARSVKLPGAGRKLPGFGNKVLEEGEEGVVAGIHETFWVELDAQDAAARLAAVGVAVFAAGVLLALTRALRGEPLPGFDHAVGRTGHYAHACAGILDGLMVKGVDHY